MLTSVTILGVGLLDPSGADGWRLAFGHARARAGRRDRRDVAAPRPTRRDRRWRTGTDDARWVDALEPDAPDIVAAWRGIEAGRTDRGPPGGPQTGRRRNGRAPRPATRDTGRGTRRRGRGAVGGGPRAATAARRTGTSRRRSGTTARPGPASASPRPGPPRGRWPPNAPDVVPGVPGPADADRATLLRRIGQSQRLVERSARTVAGHEMDPCPLEHPLVGPTALRGVARLRRRPRPDAPRAAARR